MTASTIRSKSLIKNKVLRNLLAAGFWLAVWEVSALLVDKSVLLPTPQAVAWRLIILLSDTGFLASIGLSVIRIFTGFAAAVLAGLVIAFLTNRFVLLNTVIAPVMNVIRATPVASFIILTLVWLSRGSVPSFISFLMVLPIIWSNVCLGLESVSTEQREVCDIYDFGFSKRMRYLIVPSVLPGFVTGIRISLGLAWKAGVAAEVLCTPALSLGKLLYESKLYLETADLFAVTSIIIIISFILERVIIALIGRIGKKREAGANAKNRLPQ